MFAHPRRQLIVTADDFGAAPCIDSAIRRAIETGQVGTVGALTNFPGAAEAITALRKEHPQTDIGVHLNITAGPPLTDPARLGVLCNSRGVFRGLSALLDHLGRIDITALETELRSQIERLVELGIQPDHLSSHHNILAIFPPFQDLLLALAVDYNLPIRTVLAVSQTHSRRFGYAKTRERAGRSILGMIGRRPHRALAILPGAYMRLRSSSRIVLERGVRTPDHMIDSLYGAASVRNLRHILYHLPEGISELVMHLGDCECAADLPEGIESDLITERRMERNLVLNGTLGRMLKREQITPARYGDILRRVPPRPVIASGRSA